LGKNIYQKGDYRYLRDVAYDHKPACDFAPRGMLRYKLGFTRGKACVRYYRYHLKTRFG
jgi:hypothetical protein